MKTKTFLDAGALLAVVRNEVGVMTRALSILNDPNREFVSSIFLKLELLPMAIYFQKQAEIALFTAFLHNATEQPCLDRILQTAFREACQHGMSAMDALHVAFAAAAGADELVTTEKSTRPIHRTGLVRVRSIA